MKGTLIFRDAYTTYFCKKKYMAAEYHFEQSFQILCDFSSELGIGKICA